jgi:hypothetical protein
VKVEWRRIAVIDLPPLDLFLLLIFSFFTFYK